MFLSRKVKIVSGQRELTLLEVMKEKSSMTKEKDLLIDIMVKIDKIYHPDPGDDLYVGNGDWKKGTIENKKTRDARITKQLKQGLPTSPWLADAILNVQDRLDWSSLKKWFMIFLSFFTLIILGWGLYIFDVYTDSKFVYNMFRFFTRNFDKIVEGCKHDLKEHVDRMIETCRDNFDDKECYEMLKNSSYFVKNCFEQEQRFNGSSVDEWQTAGMVSLSHIILPFIIMLIVHLYFVATAARFSWKRLFTIPIPLVSKLVAFVYQVKICKLNEFKQRNKQEISKIQEKLLTNLAFINITIVIEAAIESCFQFCFQAVYRMPSLFISFMAEGQGFQWKDLVNWGTFSVVISFASFAWTFTSIR